MVWRLRIGVLCTISYQGRFTLTSKKATKCWYESPMSSTPHISRMECIEREGAPTSTVLHPSPDAKIGPIVLPHPISLLTQNSWHGMPLLFPTSLQSPKQLILACWLSIAFAKISLTLSVLTAHYQIWQRCKKINQPSEDQPKVHEQLTGRCGSQSSWWCVLLNICPSMNQAARVPQVVHQQGTRIMGIVC